MTSQAERTPRRTWLARLTGNGVNTTLGLAGLIIAVLPIVVRQRYTREVALVVLTVAVLVLVARLVYLSTNGIWVRRPRRREMSNPEFFGQLHAEVELQMLDRAGELSDGSLAYTGAEIPGAYLLLYRTVTRSPDLASRRVDATDLTGNPSLLTQRGEYLAANRRLLQADGEIRRIFICREADLMRPDYFTALDELVSVHQDMGVECGLCVRERLSSRHAIDFVIFGNGAVIVEEEQADARYMTGRSTVYFKRVQRWQSQFEDMWEENESCSATKRWRQYRDSCLRSQTLDSWNEDELTAVLARLL